MSCYVLYNPFAGNGCAANDLKYFYEKFGKDVLIINLTEITDYKAFFKNIDKSDSIILCGGDGTINRFVNNTEGINIECDILYYPMGTGNDFLTDLGKKGCDTQFSIKKYIQNLPLVEVNGKKYRFINNVGFGIDGYCAAVGEELKSKSKKKVNYTAIAIKGLLFYYKPTNATITVDGVEYKYKNVWLAPTMKGRYYGGGMMASPDQDRNDENGELSVMLFYGKGRLATLMAFPSIFKGEHINKKGMVALHKGREISVVFDSPAPLQIDGETILGVTSYKATASQLIYSL